MPTLVSKHYNTSFTLSFQGIEFQLQPEQIGSKVSLQHGSCDQVLLEISNFTGQLVIMPSKMSSTLPTTVSTNDSALESTQPKKSQVLKNVEDDVWTTTNIPPSPEPSKNNEEDEDEEEEEEVEEENEEEEIKSITMTTPTKVGIALERMLLFVTKIY
jgi:hypothetical protein